MINEEKLIEEFIKLRMEVNVQGDLIKLMVKRFHEFLTMMAVLEDDVSDGKD